MPASGDGASSQWPAGPRIILAPPQTARCRVAFHSAQPELQSTPVPYDAECAHGLPVAGVFEEVRTAMQLAFALIGPSLQKHSVSCRREEGRGEDGRGGVRTARRRGAGAGRRAAARSGRCGRGRGAPRPSAAACCRAACCCRCARQIKRHCSSPAKSSRQKWSEPAAVKHMALSPAPSIDQLRAARVLGRRCNLFRFSAALRHPVRACAARAAHSNFGKPGLHRSAEPAARPRTTARTEAPHLLGARWWA